MSRELPKHISTEISTAVSTITHESSSKKIIDFLSALDTPKQNSTWWNDYTEDKNKPVIVNIDESMSSATVEKEKTRTRRSSKELNRIRCANTVARHGSQSRYNAALKEACVRCNQSIHMQRDIDLHSK